MELSLDCRKGDKIALKMHNGFEFELEAYGDDSIRLIGRPFQLAGFNEKVRFFDNDIGTFRRLEVKALPKEGEED